MSRTKYTGSSDGILLYIGGDTIWVVVVDLPSCLVTYADINAKVIH
jgi:hypothetical protein